jgi:hypothetical protein
MSTEYQRIPTMSPEQVTRHHGWTLSQYAAALASGCPNNGDPLKIDEWRSHVVALNLRPTTIAWQRSLLSEEMIREAFNWALSEWQRAQGCAFPPATDHRVVTQPGRLVRTEPLFLAHAVDEWRERLLSLKLDGRWWARGRL